MTWILRKVAFAVGLAITRRLLRIARRRRAERRALEASVTPGSPASRGSSPR
ncbi:hypothetical protein SAMN05216298_1514 [Glycomyces sambucus]|uniref:Uncharacterized protein n=1 Tax=Glycomyces sambucus TaxID=380244 RepID=A0A1G9F1G4_9ACTN|nr:hypothetical protein [Glycomyces sambucus]SDK82178.1 hypothetical protein SAMN05216298_1514 [Glycomyces sambucus]